MRDPFAPGTPDRFCAIVEPHRALFIERRHIVTVDAERRPTYQRRPFLDGNELAEEYGEPVLAPHLGFELDPRRDRPGPPMLEVRVTYANHEPYEGELLRGVEAARFLDWYAPNAPALADPPPIPFKELSDEERAARPDPGDDLPF